MKVGIGFFRHRHTWQFKRSLGTESESLARMIEKSRPYANTSTWGLVNSYIVYQLCSTRMIVQSIPAFLKLAKATKTTFILESVVKLTFLKHFCGGEDINEVVPISNALKQSKIGSIVDLSMETDLGSQEISGKEALKWARKVVNLKKESVDVASSQPGNYIALKPTSLTPPSLLQAWTSTLNRLKKAVYEMDPIHGQLTLEQVQDLSKVFPNLSKLDLRTLFHQYDLDKDGKLNYNDLSAIFSFDQIEYCMALVNESANLESHERSLTLEHLETAKIILDELRNLFDYAKVKNVMIIMDAEQTYFQPGIDNLTMTLCKLYNPRQNDGSGWNRPLLYQTYQMYRTDTLDRLKGDCVRAQQEGFAMGVKLVRGAYMLAEKEWSDLHKSVYPIHTSLEDTHKSFNAGVDYVIDSQRNVNDFNGDFVTLSLIVASHNHASIERVMKAMETYNIPKDKFWISFGQLKGMQDGATGLLAAKSFQTNKVIPYGPVSVVIPYLHRRALENFAMLSSMKYDKDALLRELKLRVFQ